MLFNRMGQKVHFDSVYFLVWHGSKFTHLAFTIIQCSYHRWITILGFSQQQKRVTVFILIKRVFLSNLVWLRGQNFNRSYLDSFDIDYFFF